MHFQHVVSFVSHVDDLDSTGCVPSEMRDTFL